MDTPQFSLFDTKVQTLGTGISGSTHLYQTKTKPARYYVVKTYHEREKYESKAEYKQRVVHEYAILSQVKHRNVIRPYKFEVSLTGSTIRLYMEAGTATITQLVKENAVEESGAGLWRQCCDGVRFLHDHNICHRDLKPDNLVVDSDGVVKIIDWATARVVVDDEPTIGIVGSDGYLAPETVLSIRYDGKKADIWSLGIILHYILTAKLPWKSARTTDKVYVKYLERRAIAGAEPVDARSVPFSGLPTASHNLLAHILVPDPVFRADIGAFGEDGWFLGLAPESNPP